MKSSKQEASFKEVVRLNYFGVLVRTSKGIPNNTPGYNHKNQVATELDRGHQGSEAFFNDVIAYNLQSVIYIYRVYNIAGSLFSR